MVRKATKRKVMKKAAGLVAKGITRHWALKLAWKGYKYIKR